MRRSEVKNSSKQRTNQSTNYKRILADRDLMFNSCWFSVNLDKMYWKTILKFPNLSHMFGSKSDTPEGRSTSVRTKETTRKSAGIACVDKFLFCLKRKEETIKNCRLWNRDSRRCSSLSANNESKECQLTRFILTEIIIIIN